MSSADPLRIGTRDSELATWQARQVAAGLREAGAETELVFVKSEGDLDRSTPLSEMGGKGVFTKALDNALMDGEIDLAVHSFKDLPTRNPLPLRVAAVPPRGDARDCLVAPGGDAFLEEDGEAVIATGSNRRRAQWLNRYPRHRVTGLRGNVNTRLEKIGRHGWEGAIFAAAGLQRIGLDGHITRYLDWMVPAAAQGAMAVMVREGDARTAERVARLNHEPTARCARLEREYLGMMEAGCSAPVGAWARVRDGEIRFRAVALSLDGSERLDYEKTIASPPEGEGKRAAEELLGRGADRFLEEVRSGEGE